jgi:signal transduction histidine kinase
VKPSVHDRASEPPRFATSAHPDPASPEGEADARSRPPVIGRLRLSQWMAIIVSALAAVLVAGVIVGAGAISRENDARREIIQELDPAREASLQIGTAIVAQQNGVRGFALNGLDRNLQAYHDAIAQERAATAEVRRIIGDSPHLSAAIDAVGRTMAAWRRDFAEVGIARIQREGLNRPSNPARREAATRAFARVTNSLQTLRAEISSRRAAAQARLSDATGSLTISFFSIAAALALGLIGAAVTMRRAIARPLERLAAHVRVVSRGNLEHRVVGEGPADLVELADDVDSMRMRIVRDLEEVRLSRVMLQEQAADLERKATELARSNDELEQFAYVASHDLQEPLRKVASFCQLLQRRYAGQLDERADQYIEFAVDGAKRMQSLISDLLSFSRVGRTGTEMVDVPLDDAVRAALDNLTRRVDETQASVDIGALPMVSGEPILLTAVFQNLIGNALKFHGEEPPVVHVKAELDDGMWTISCSDDGIGIAPEFAERIFAIFQRLHPKETYEGTGIGLALCRKIVEHHGGRIWLDTTVPSGTTFRFTLPAHPDGRG